MPPSVSFQQAFADYDRPIALRRIRLACVIAMVLMPAGYLVDLVMFPGQREMLSRFLEERLVAVVLMGALLFTVRTRFGQRWHRVLGVVLAMIPAGAMAWIIAGTKEHAAHPYYAGLNLVLMGIGLMLQWNLLQSLVATFLVFAMYLGLAYTTLTVYGRGQPNGSGAVLNNSYFLLVTGAIVVIGNSVQTRLRIREFEARGDLERSQDQLGASNRQLLASQAELAASNRGLKEREEELQKTNARLRELDELKGRFFANISHELRTPLTLLIAPLETLRQDPVLTADRLTKESLDTMHANGMRLLKLINDLLDLVRLDAGSLQLRKSMIEVEPFFTGLLNAIKGVATGKSQKLGLYVEPELTHVWADPDKLEKVFLNGVQVWAKNLRFKG